MHLTAAAVGVNDAVQERINTDSGDNTVIVEITVLHTETLASFRDGTRNRPA